MRIKRGTISKRKHKKILRYAKGYRMTKRKLIKVAKEATLHAGQYAYAGRRLRKRQMRQLWISRISQAVKKEGLNYSTFISKLSKAKIDLDRKIIANLITTDQKAFQAILDKVKPI